MCTGAGAAAGARAGAGGAWRGGVACSVGTGAAEAPFPPGGAAALGLTYLGGDRVVPHYGGGMSTAKAALQIDAQQLASNLGPKKIRVNLISAGPYASRAARAIGDIDKMIQYAAERAPLQRGIEPEEVANAAVFLCSPLASAITGEVLYVDCGYNVMGV